MKMNVEYVFLFLDVIFILLAIYVYKKYNKGMYI